MPTPYSRPITAFDNLEQAKASAGQNATIITFDERGMPLKDGFGYLPSREGHYLPKDAQVIIIDEPYTYKNIHELADEILRAAEFRPDEVKIILCGEREKLTDFLKVNPGIRSRTWLEESSPAPTKNPPPRPRGPGL